MSNKAKFDAKDVKVTGTMKEGKLELDPKALEDVAGGAVRKGGGDDDGGLDFKPVNAPFDPVAVEAA